VFGSAILDVAVGLIFTFLVVSLVSSAATEGMASALGWRANTLLQGVKDLLNDQQFTGLALAVYNHGLVNPQASGTAQSQQQLTAKPSYIDPKQFAAAIIDSAGLLNAINVAAMQQKVGAIQDPQLRTMLTGIVEHAGGDINQIRDQLASWFDTSMDRVSGAYKRQTQLWSFVIALAVTIGLNVDAISIAKTIWVQPMLVKELPPLSNQKPADGLADLQGLGLPLGWNFPTKELCKGPSSDKPEPANAGPAGKAAPGPGSANSSDEDQNCTDGAPRSTLDQPGSANPSSPTSAPGKPPAQKSNVKTPVPLAWQWAMTLAGWVITAVATLFGAPFWFDTLQRFVQLRGAGSK
jgi:hypothetical protein